jgi:hypothetical protein
VYTWPRVCSWIAQYVQGCRVCQQNKKLTHCTWPPLYKISVPSNALPFSQVAMDLITGLPKSWGFNSIPTIIDYGCSWAAIFLPCQNLITSPQIAQLYYKHIYLSPNQLITGLDPKITPLVAVRMDNPMAELQVNQLRQQRQLASYALNEAAQCKTLMQALFHSG